MTTKQKATCMMLISVLLFSLMQLFVSMTSSNISVFQQIFFRNLLGMVICAYFIHREKVSYFGTRETQPFLLARSLCGFLGLLLSFYAMRHALLSDATIVTRTGPFFTTVFSVIFLKEKLTKIQIPVLCMIFFGGWLAANPSFDSSFLPLGCALLSAVCNGICYPLLRYFHDKEHAMTVIMHFSTFCTLSSIPFILYDFVPAKGIDIVYLALIALTGALGQFFLTYAYRLGPASEVAIYDQFTVVLSIVFGYLFLHQIPSVRAILGGVLIVGASVFAFFYYNRLQKRV